MNNRWLGGLIGLVGGIAGLAAMKYAMKLAPRVGLAAPPPDDDAAHPERRYEAAARGEERGDGRGKRQMSLIGTVHEPGEPAPAALGRAVYQKVRGRRPDERTHRRLGTGVHLGYGLLMAAGYGVMRAGKPGLDLLGGLAFAIGLFALGDELAVPLLGLSDAPTATPLREHGKYLAGHVAYGVATAAATQGLAKLVDRVID